MMLENRAVAKRLTCLLCSIGTIGCYSYLIGGVGGYLFGRGRPFVALAGFVCGTLLALAAIKSWRGYLKDLDAIDALDKPAAQDDDSA
jgi:hypothetical protein